MKSLGFWLLFLGFNVAWVSSNAQYYGAVSVHMTYFFPSNDAVLKMQKIKIVQSANASYFEVNRFLDGYAGLQQTPSSAYGTPFILISSLWDYNTAGGIYSLIDYADSTTRKSRFGGEGDGSKTINPYKWEMNTWYNLVNRAWKSNGRVHVATYIQNMSTGKWFHTATISNVEKTKFLDSYNDAFIENWESSNQAWDGSHIRKAFYKDCWNINPNGQWEKNTSALFSANNGYGDSTSTGIYYNSFNSFYDNVEDVYCMQVGGTTTRSPAFNNGRSLALPAQENLGLTPNVELGVISSLYASHSNDTTYVNWTMDDYKTPQLSAKIELIDEYNHILETIQDTIPEKRTASIYHPFNNGNYTVKVTVTDIFNQICVPKTYIFAVAKPIPENTAPTVHLNCTFPSNDAILKMQKFKILQTANASNFNILTYTNGNAGVQQKSDASSIPYVLISSLLDPNTSGGIYSSVDYISATTTKSRLGGNPNGWKTTNPYNWHINTWYNLVNRSWKANGKLFIATFIYNSVTNKWLHTATQSIADPNKYLTATNDVFIENWEAKNPLWNGSQIRKAFYKDCWNMNIKGGWEKNSSALFSANTSSADSQINGTYYKSFNAYYDQAENAYYMQTGGNTSPAPEFNNKRTISLPTQANQGTAPELTLGTISAMNISQSKDSIYVSWTIDESKSPQLSSKIELLNETNQVLSAIEDTLPEKRSAILFYPLNNGKYTVRVTITDIFNQLSTPKTSTFIIDNPLPENSAPTMHLTSYFPSNDAILKMQKIKIVQSARASNFQVNTFTNGVSGLLQPLDSTIPNQLYTSIKGANSIVDYLNNSTIKNHLGGGQDGWKTNNPYAWQMNTWYNIVNKAWKMNGKVYIATFIQNTVTGAWLHTSTLSNLDPNYYLTGINDVVIENLEAKNPLFNGTQMRTIYLKDGWNMNLKGGWEKNTSVYFSANNTQEDFDRNGIYHNSFNAFYDNVENAYGLQHGGSAKPSSAFNNNRFLNLPLQSNLGASPELTVGAMATLTATHSKDSTYLNWTNDDTKSPQFSVKFEFIDSRNQVVKTTYDTLPERRSLAIHNAFSNGNYSIRATLTDIFNQLSTPKIATFTVSDANSLSVNNTANLESKISISPNPARDYVVIQGKNLIHATFYDASGRKMMSVSLHNSKSEINIQSLKQGLYLVEIQDKNGTLYRDKLTIE